MKKEKYDSDDNDMREEYDFSGGVRGKHYKAYRKVNPGKVKRKTCSPFHLFFENSVKPTIVVKCLL